MFLGEAGLPYSSATVSKGDITIEKILEEKQTFDLSVRFEKLGTDDSDRKWNPLAPVSPSSVLELPNSSNLLHVSIEFLQDEEDRYIISCSYSPGVRLTEHCYRPSSFLLASTADRRLNVLDVPSCSLHDSHSTLHDSPILSWTALDRRHLLTTSMSGQLTVSHVSGHVLDQRRDHTKYIVQVCVYRDDATTWVATAGWDAKVHLYQVATGHNTTPKLGEPIATISLPSNPEALAFVVHPETGQPILIVTRRDSTFLYYYTVDASAKLLGQQNLAPHSNAWIAFTPSAIALAPHDSSLLAVATSAIPHMKLIIVRLLLPPINAPAIATAVVSPPAVTSLVDIADRDPSTPTQASQAREALAVQDREAAAILIHCTTLAPQTQYSTPALAWRPDGTGVWVNSDDGFVRGIETVSGKIVSTLKGHEPGSKVRCLCAGRVNKQEGGVGEEWLVSGGFDQKLIVWKPEEV